MLQLSNLYGKHHPVSISCLNEGGSSKHLKCIELILFLHPFLKESKVNDWYLFLEPMFVVILNWTWEKGKKEFFQKLYKIQQEMQIHTNRIKKISLFQNSDYLNLTFFFFHQWNSKIFFRFYFVFNLLIQGGTNLKKRL